MNASTERRAVNLMEGLPGGCLAIDWCPSVNNSSLVCAGKLPATIGQAAATASPSAAGWKMSGRVGGNPGWGEGLLVVTSAASASASPCSAHKWIEYIHA